jgi:Spy/CpxP family protein refolding chaperone
MRGTKHIAITLVLIGVLCGTFALAQTAVSKADDFRAKAEAATKERLGQLIYYYKPSEDQKAKIKEVLIAQYKDLSDYGKLYGPKIKALDDEIAAIAKKREELKAEIAALEKRKAAHAEVQAELRLDHKAEINNVITTEQRLTRLSSHIRGNAIYYQYFAVLPKAQQEAMKAKCDATALELITTKKADDSNAVYAAARKIRNDTNKILTPELRQAGDTEYLMGKTMRKFDRIKLTESQKSKIRDLCDKAAKRKVEVYAQYAKVGRDREALDKDRSALRHTISEMSSSSYYYKIRDEAIQSVLTDEQLKAGGYKRKS